MSHVVLNINDVIILAKNSEEVKILKESHTFVGTFDLYVFYKNNQTGKIAFNSPFSSFVMEHKHLNTIPKSGVDVMLSYDPYYNIS